MDETTAELMKTARALELEKKKTDSLLYQMLPEKVANSLREGIKVAAGNSSYYGYLKFRNISALGMN